MSEASLDIKSNGSNMTCVVPLRQGVFSSYRTLPLRVIESRFVETGLFDAIVSDAGFLQYRINKGKQQGQFKSLTVLPYELEAQNYAFILPEGSLLREDINRSLLTVRARDEWRDRLADYRVQ